MAKTKKKEQTLIKTLSPKEYEKVLEKIWETLAKINTYGKAYVVDNIVIAAKNKALLVKDKENKVYVVMNGQKFDKSLEPITFITVN